MPRRRPRSDKTTRTTSYNINKVESSSVNPLQQIVYLLVGAFQDGFTKIIEDRAKIKNIEIKSNCFN